MNVAVLGYGKQGASAVDYYLKNGHTVTVCDHRESISLLESHQAVTLQLGPTCLTGLDKFDIIVRSPSVHPAAISADNPDVLDILDRVSTNTNEFLRATPSMNIIGVTGTKGKGTTSTLIAAMLQKMGKRVHVGGNIGTPPLELLKDDIQPDDWIVMELANFQLIDLKQSPPIAVCLMIEPEHQDWHGTVEEYYEAKRQLFKWQRTEDIAIYYAPDEISRSIADASKAQKKLAYFGESGAHIKESKIIINDTEVCDVQDIRLLGDHNQQNVCAAITAVWQVAQDKNAIVEALHEIKGLPFRIEFRREINGVRFYDDSFASAPGATVAAINAVPGPKVMILGGHDRGLDLTEIAEAASEHSDDIRQLVLIGASAPRIAAVLQQHDIANFVHEHSKDMGDIVQTALRYAQPGDAVVLSPGFPSFDMFKNFEVRGHAFNEAVDRL